MTALKHTFFVIGLLLLFVTCKQGGEVEVRKKKGGGGAIQASPSQAPIYYPPNCPSLAPLPFRSPTPHPAGEDHDHDHALLDEGHDHAPGVSPSPLTRPSVLPGPTLAPSGIFVSPTPFYPQTGALASPMMPYPTNCPK